MIESSEGEPPDRADERLKVTGGVHYTGDIVHPDLTLAVSIQSRIAPDLPGIPVERARCELADTFIPEKPISAGSQTVASIGVAATANAVYHATGKRIRELPVAPEQAVLSMKR